MKHARLGLARKKGVNFSVAADGRIFRTENGESKTIKKVKLPEAKDFLYFIDDDGDLAREWRAPPRKTAREVRGHATKPESAKLDARALYQYIDELLFPPDQVELAHSGFVEDDIMRSREIYEKEFKRLASEISRALGPGVALDVAYGVPGIVWWLKDRPVLLRLGWEDKEFPGDIQLEIPDDDVVKRASKARGKGTKRKR